MGARQARSGRRPEKPASSASRVAYEDQDRSQEVEGASMRLPDSLRKDLDGFGLVPVDISLFEVIVEVFAVGR
jgi:hypothetical protein